MSGRKWPVRWPVFASRASDRLGDAGMAAAEMAAAMSALGAELMKSKSISKLGALKVMGELDLYEDQEALEEDIIADIDSVMEKAQGPDGDRVKYEYAVRQMESRWRLFVGLFDIGDDEPTVEMVKRFCGFMYRTRQNSSTSGRQGLGDGMAKMAKYTLVVRARTAEPETRALQEDRRRRTAPSLSDCAPSFAERVREDGVLELARAGGARAREPPEGVPPRDHRRVGAPQTSASTGSVGGVRVGVRTIGCKDVERMPGSTASACMQDGRTSTAAVSSEARQGPQQDSRVHSYRMSHGWQQSPHTWQSLREWQEPARIPEPTRMPVAFEGSRTCACTAIMIALAACCHSTVRQLL